MATNNVRRPSAGRVRPHARGLQHKVVLVAIAVLILAPLAWATRTQLKPGWNMFSAQQDVEVGQQTSREAEQQLPMLNNSRVDNYLNNLGRSLAAYAPGEKYPYQFKVVNDRAINAFALPGGPVYIHRGVVEAADNEAQLASVIAHEISHVALRHGTNQATKAYVAQVPLAILGGVLGSNSTGAILAQIGAGFATNSLLLKYSRTAESQADTMGTQILYDSGYDDRAMTQFFEKIMAQDQGGRPVEFFSNHPNPDNRIGLVNQEIANLGGSPRGSKADSQEFQDIKRYVLSLPAPPGKGITQILQGDTGSGASGQGTTTGLWILAASYGAKDRFNDVRQRLQSLVQNDRLNLQVTNSSMGGDPIGEPKTLRIRYQWAGRTYDVTVPEKQWVSIPTEQQQTETTAGLRILAASYGAKDRFNDVRQRLQSLVQNDRLNLQVTNSSMGGNPIGEPKTLRIRYEWAGRTYDMTVPENQWVSIPTQQQQTQTTAPGGTQPEWPSDRFRAVENSFLRIQHPDNWQAYGQGDVAMTIAPNKGLVSDGQGNQALAYGVIVNIFEPHFDQQQLQPEGYGQLSGTSLENATDRLVEELRRSNQTMRIIRYHEGIQVARQRALSTDLSNESPLGGRETDWLVTVQHPEGLLFFVFVAPDRDFQNYNHTFRVMLDSVRFRQ